MNVKIEPSEIQNLAPMSTTVSQLACVLNDPGYGITEVARLIELDGALTANVLHWANSAFYRSRIEIDTIKTAVMRLGINNIVKLAIGNSLAKPMKKKVPGYSLVEDELWRHNVAAGLTIETVKRLTPLDVPAVAFTATMLHDIGKLILNRHLDANVILQLRHEIETRRCPYYVAEQQLLNTDHAQVGAAVAGYWKFPEELIMVIEKHHSSDVKHSLLLDLVKFADNTAKRIGVGTGYQDLESMIDIEILKRLNFDSTLQQQIEIEVKEKLDQALKEFEL